MENIHGQIHLSIRVVYRVYRVQDRTTGSGYSILVVDWGMIGPGRTHIITIDSAILKFFYTWDLRVAALGPPAEK
ncbi:hypothetical protein ACJX0J_031249, partial [Zea mays]